MAKTSSIVRYACLAVWLAAILAGVGSYLIHPQWFTAENIAAFLLRFEGAIWVVYLAMSALRGFSLLPSTPLVFAGTMLFPAEPFTLLAVSLAGIIISSSMIYFFSEYLGFHEYFEGHNPELTHKIKARLERPSGVAFVAAWAFFPLVPTDLVCYLAGTTMMDFWKFIAAILIGELALCSLYIFFGEAVLTFVR
ncbi:TVP38/TMEM64 family protein [soil metagenome]